MKQKSKRLIAVMLIIAMLLGMMPETSIVSYATGVEQTSVEEQTEEVTTEQSSKTTTETTEETTEVEVEEASTESEQESTTEDCSTESTGDNVSKETEPSIQSEAPEVITEEKTEDVKTENTTEEVIAPQVKVDDVPVRTMKETVSQNYIIYNDGTWDTNCYRWFVNVNSKKHYVFCLNYGKTMYNGMYYGELTQGYSGFSAFRKSIALNYFYGVNGNTWSKNKHYGDVQRVIWDKTGTDVSNRLMSYANHAWKLTDLNDEREAGTTSYSSKLKGITKAQAKDDTAIKKMIESLTDGKHIVDLSEGYDGATDSYSGTISLKGQAWKYFNKGGFDGSGSDIVVDGIFGTDGVKLSSDVATASLNDSGNLVVNIDDKANIPEDAYTVIMHVNFDILGADSINYLLTEDGKQNLTYSAPGNSSAYFAIRVYGNTDYEDAKLKINKVDEFGTFVPGCTFLLTGVEGDATNMNPDSKTINSVNQVYNIKYSGYYKLVETAVPSSEFKLDPTEHYVYAEYNDEGQLLLYEAYKTATGAYNHYKADEGFIGSGVTGGNPLHQGAGTATFSYYFPNKYSSGNAELTKYANVLVKYDNGKYVYEKRTLDDVGFTFYAAEDIYLGDTLVFEKDEELYSGTHWGSFDAVNMGTTEYTHTIEIDGKLVYYGDNGHVSLGSLYRGYTANKGKITISDLPAGSYYCVESDLSHPGLVMAVERHYFTVTANKTTAINGADGIINEQAPTDIYVYKQDENTKEYLEGAEFTVYANINNTNYDGQKLFSVDQTVDVVVERNLVTGAEKVESKTWLPLQTATSNDKGIVVFDNLPYGDYLIAEIKAPEGYELSEKVIRFTHSLPEEGAADYASGFVNEYTIGDIKSSRFSIYKKAEKAYLNTSTEKNVDAYVFKEEAIAGAVFGVYADSEIKNTLGEVVYKQGDLVTKCTTNAEGIAQFGGAMFVGKYYFQEIQTADDSIYELDTTKHYFEVTGKEGTKTLNEEAIVNKQYKGSIKVIKTDGKTKVPLSDVEFDLLDVNKNVIGTYVTDDKGEIHINNLPIGTYYLQETKTKKGYKLTDEVVEVVLSLEELNKEVEFENFNTETDITIKTDSTYSGSGEVRTGDMSPIGIIVLLFVLSSFGAAYLGKKNQGALKPLSERAKKLMTMALVLLGVIAVGGLTVKAAASLKELSSEELHNAEYNGTVYKYALQKQYETSDKEEEYAFDDEVNGMELAEVNYEVVDTILQKKTIEETKDYKDLLVKDESKVSKTITVDGKEYELQNITWSEVPNMESVSYTVDYGYQTAEPKPDATYEYTYTSPVTKKDNTVILPYVGMEKGSESWVDGFSATVTFHNTDGVYFTLGNREFQYNADKITLKENDFKELVKMLGYDTSKYRLTDIAWAGKEYQKNGKTCRDAKATGQQYAASYKARYADEVENGKIYTAHATYSCEVEVPADEAAPTYVKRATAYYKDASVWTNIITFVTEHKALSAVMVGSFFFVILVLVVLLLRSKKPTSNREEVYEAE